MLQLTIFFLYILDVKEEGESEGEMEEEFPDTDVKIEFNR